MSNLKYYLILKKMKETVKKKSNITALSSQKKAYKLHNHETTTGFKAASYRIQRVYCTSNSSDSATTILEV
jgi:hypothetical protein